MIWRGGGVAGGSNRTLRQEQIFTAAGKRRPLFYLEGFCFLYSTRPVLKSCKQMIHHRFLLRCDALRVRDRNDTHLDQGWERLDGSVCVCVCVCEKLHFSYQSPDNLTPSGGKRWLAMVSDVKHQHTSVR